MQIHMIQQIFHTKIRVEKWGSLGETLVHEICNQSVILKEGKGGVKDSRSRKKTERGREKEQERERARRGKDLLFGRLEPEARDSLTNYTVPH